MRTVRIALLAVSTLVIDAMVGAAWVAALVQASFELRPLDALDASLLSALAVFAAACTVAALLAARRIP